MGMDIHISIVKDGKIIAQDIFDGRNTAWFNNMMQRGTDLEYDYMPANCGVSPQAPKEIETEYNEDFMFGQHYISVLDFKNWFDTYKPHLNAGWITVYDKWVWDKKGIKPADVRYDDIRRTIPEDEPAYNWCFIEYEKECDCSHWLMIYLIENEIPNDADITYCFDH